MKKLLMVGITSLVLFALSAAASYFWQQKQKNGPAAEVSGKDGSAARELAKRASTALSGASNDDSAPRAAARPPYNPGTEEIARMTNELRTRLTTVRDREEQLTARKKMIELIQEDIRGERSALDELRTQIKSELEALNDAVDGAEKQRSTLDEERQKISKNTQEMEARIEHWRPDRESNRPS